MTTQSKRLCRSVKFSANTLRRLLGFSIGPNFSLVEARLGRQICFQAINGFEELDFQAITFEFPDFESRGLLE